MRIWSGQVCLGETGIEVVNGIHTGDIIILWHREHAGTEYEMWAPTEHLSAVVTDLDTGEHYPMGIRTAGFDAPDWRVQVVKKFSDVISGEHWPAWGFRYTD